MSEKQQNNLFPIYLRDFNETISDLGDKMKVDIKAKTRYGVTGDYLAQEDRTGDAIRCFYLEIIMNKKHVLFRAFTKKFMDTDKIMFMDGIKKMLYKLAVQMLSEQQQFILDEQAKFNGSKEGTSEVPGEAGGPEKQDGEEDQVLADAKTGLAKEG